MDFGGKLGNYFLLIFFCLVLDIQSICNFKEVPLPFSMTWPTFAEEIGKAMMSYGLFSGKICFAFRK